MVSRLGSQLGFQLGGTPIQNIRRITLPGQDEHQLMWDAIPGAVAYAVMVNGQFAGNTTANSMRIHAREVFGVEVYQSGSDDPGFNWLPASGWVTAFSPNRIGIVVSPVAGAVLYRVYWDSGMGYMQYPGMKSSLGFPLGAPLGFGNKSAAYLLGQAIEDGSASYTIWTPPLDTGDYKFVTTSVDALGNESPASSITTHSITVPPKPVTGFKAVNVGGGRIKLSWTAPANAVTLDLFQGTAGGPDYSTVVVVHVGAGYGEWTTGVLADGIHSFGIRVNDGTLEETNTDVVVTAFMRNGVLVDDIPPIPILDIFDLGNGMLRIMVHVINPVWYTPGVQTNLYGNSGSGAVDYNTILATLGLNNGPFNTGTAVIGPVVDGTWKFGCKAVSDAGVLSESADEVSVIIAQTPLAVAPTFTAVDGNG
jgi:hypothetical protein